MKRSAAYIKRLAFPACAALAFFVAVPAFAQQFTAAQANAMQQQQAQQLQANLQQQQQQQAQFYAMQQYAQQQQTAQLGLNNNNNMLAGVAGVGAPQITGYNPVTGQPIYSQPQQPAPKIKTVLAEDINSDMMGTNNRPPARADLENVPKENKVIDGKAGMPIDIRRDALREAAVSFGARGGLAWRTFEIRKELETRADYMDKVYDFRQLLIPAPSGLLIEPPVISESINAMLIEGDGQQAAVSDRIYNIVNNAKIVPTARTWRNYLEREWGDVDPPPDILRPENAEERKIWIDLVRKGWEEGITQADDIFKDDLNTLQADFQGMIRYRVLLAQGMVSPPYALQVDRGVTGDGSEMRVGDRAVQITGKPELITGSDSWQPASR